MEVIKVKEGDMGGPEFSKTGVFIRGRDTRALFSQGTDRGKTPWRYSKRVADRKQDLTRNNPHQHLDLGLPVSRTVRKCISAVQATQSVVSWHDGSPS